MISIWWGGASGRVVGLGERDGPGVEADPGGEGG